MAPVVARASQPESLSIAKPDVGEGTASVMSASFNYTNSIIGAGIIGLPYAIHRTGLYAGVLLLVGVALLTSYSSRLLITCGKAVNQRTFEGLCLDVIGKQGYIAVLCFMFTFAFGGMLAYLIIIGDTSSEVATFLFNEDFIFANRRFAIMFFGVLCVLPLSLLRDISNLAFTSFVSLAFVAVIVVSVVYRGSIVGQEMGTSVGLDPEGIHFIQPTLFAGIGAMSFAFVCNHNAFIIFNSLSNPTPARWAQVSYLSVGSAAVFSAIMAIGAYLSFMSSVKPDILNNFAHKDVVITMARSLLGLSMIMTYPMEMFVARHCLLEIMYDGPVHEVPRLYHSLVSLSIWTFTMFLAMILDNLGLVLEITGAFAASFIGYILPAYCWLKIIGFETVLDDIQRAWSYETSGVRAVPRLSKRLQATFKNVGPMLLFSFGVIAMIAGTFSAISTAT